MRKLEDELGVLIFDRSKQPITPTTIGSKIIHQARTIFRETGQIENILSEFMGDISGSLKIGILPTIANALIPKLIREISENHPNLKLTINEGLTKEIIDDLENDRLDVGIVSTPVKHNGLVERNLYTEKFRIYTHPNHPCYSKKAWEATDLLEDKLWLLSEGNCFRVQTINLCSLPDEKLNHLALTYESGSLQTLKKIVDFEGGATIIPEWEASELDDDSLDNLRAFRADDAGRAVGLIYTKFYAKDQIINRLEEMIMNCLPRYVSENKNLKIIES